MHQYAADFAKRAQQETGMGRVEDKTAKHHNAADATPGMEDLEVRAWSGDKGVVVEEYAPYGVVAAITPSTHPVPVMIPPIWSPSRRRSATTSTAARRGIWPFSARHFTPVPGSSLSAMELMKSGPWRTISTGVRPARSPTTAPGFSTSTSPGPVRSPRWNSTTGISSSLTT